MGKFIAGINLLTLLINFFIWYHMGIYALFISGLIIIISPFYFGYLRPIIVYYYDNNNNNNNNNMTPKISNQNQNQNENQEKEQEKEQKQNKMSRLSCIRLQRWHLSRIQIIQKKLERYINRTSSDVDLYVQCPARYGPLLSLNMIQQHSDWFEFCDTQSPKTSLNSSIIIPCTKLTQRPNFARISYADMLNNPSRQCEFAESIHRYGFALIQMPNDFEKSNNNVYNYEMNEVSLFAQIRQLYNQSLQFFLQNNVIVKKAWALKSKGDFAYRREGFHRELVEFKLCDPSTMQMESKKNESCTSSNTHDYSNGLGRTVNNTLYDLSCHVTHALLKYGEWKSEALQHLKLSERINFRDNCYMQSCLRVLHYPSTKALQKRKSNSCNWLWTHGKVMWCKIIQFITNSKSFINQIGDENLLFYSPHCDLGVLTMAPKALADGLEICIPGGEQWIDMSSLMHENDLLVHAGYTLSCMTGSFYQPLFHRVNMALPRDKCAPRFSMPYFFRMNDNIKIPVLQLETCLNLINDDMMMMMNKTNKNPSITPMKNHSKFINHIVEKWLTVSELTGRIRKERVLRKSLWLHTRACTALIIELMLWLCPEKQNNLFDGWLFA